MRAARTEVRQARGNILGIVVPARVRQRFHPGPDTVGIAPLLDQDAAQLLGDHDRVQRTARREQLVAVHPARTALVPAIDTAALAVVKDRFLDLDLDQLALFLDHHDQVQPLGPVVERGHVQREGLADLVGRDPQPLGLGLVDVQQRHRVHQVQPVLAGGDEADLGPLLAPHAPVDPVGPAECFGGKALVVDHPRLLQVRRVDQPDVQPALGHGEIRRDKLHSLRIAVDDRGRLDRVLHGLEPDPEAAEPRQREPVNSVVEDLLHARRRDDGHIGIHQRPFGLVQNGRGFTGMVVPHRHQYATKRAGPRHVGMAHHVAGAVHARALAVPEPENPVELALSAQFRLLGTPDRGRREVFVQTELEGDVVLRKRLGRPRHLHVHRPERRPAIPGHQPGGVEPGGTIPLLLHQHQSDQRLRAVQQHGGLGQVETVIQRDLLCAHGAPPNADQVHMYQATIGHTF